MNESLPIDFEPERFSGFKLEHFGSLGAKTLQPAPPRAEWRCGSKINAIGGEGGIRTLGALRLA